MPVGWGSPVSIAFQESKEHRVSILIQGYSEALIRIVSWMADVWLPDVSQLII